MLDKYMKRYNSQITPSIILGIALVIVYLSISSLNSFEEYHNILWIIKGLVLSVALFGIFFIILVKFTYLIINNNKIRYVHMLWPHRWVEIDKITEIKFASMMIILPQIKALYVIYDNNGINKWIKIYPVTFREKMLAKFIKDICN